jgi:hypothetical protein
MKYTEAMIWVSALIVGVAVVLMVAMSVEPQGDLPKPPPQIEIKKAEKLALESPEIKALMRKHGTEYLCEGWDGKQFFFRNGKKVYVK